MYYEQQLYAGVVLEYELVQRVLGQARYEAISSQKILEIVREKNKKYMSPTDKLELVLRMKNIPEYTVKVYEIQTENYYQQHNSAFDSSIELDGIHPNHVAVVAAKEKSPILRYEEVVRCEYIDQRKRGIFVVEIVGGGLVSRAVIRKGSLKALVQKTLAGHMVQILSESLEVCKPRPAQGEGQGGAQLPAKTGLYIEKKFYEANALGQIVVPFQSMTDKKSCILLHEGFASLDTIVLQREGQYYLSCAYMYNAQSFRVGQDASIIIRPQLLQNSQPASLSLLEQSQVEVKGRDSDYHVNSRMVYDVKMSDKDDLEITVPIQSFMSRIELSVSAKVKLSGDSYQTLISNFSINFDYVPSKVVGTNYLMSASMERGLELQVVGSNGEAVQHEPTEI